MRPSRWLTPFLIALSTSMGCQCVDPRVNPSLMDLRVSPLVVEFGTVGVGRSVSKQLEVTNASRAATRVEIGGVAAPFSTVEALDLAGGETLLLSIQFEPTVLGVSEIDLHVGPHEVHVSGSSVDLPVCEATAVCARSDFDFTVNACVESAVSDGTPCASSCITGMCSTGHCVGAAKSCDDSDACTIDACSETHDGGCFHLSVLCPTPTSPCEVPTCDRVNGCATEAAPDGTPCGPRSCVTKKASICLQGACVVRPLPETACGESCTSDGWCIERPTAPAVDLLSIWGSSRLDVWTVGSSGIIRHFDGNAWVAVPSGTTQQLVSVWGTGPSDVWAVGSFGTILHFDGASWAPVSSGSTSQLNGVWGSSASDVWAVGDGVVLHFDGHAWTRVLSRAAWWWLTEVWGTGPSNVWAVGSGGILLHFDGVNWTQQPSLASSLVGLGGTNASDVWTVGDSGAAFLFDGSSWTSAPTGSTWTLYDVWRPNLRDMWAVGQNGTILRFDTVSWARVDSGVSTWLTEIWGDGRNDLWVVGTAGTILHRSEVP